MPTLKSFLKGFAVVACVGMLVFMPTLGFAQTQEETAAGAPPPAAAPAAPGGSLTSPAASTNTGKPVECKWYDVACGLMNAFQSISIWIGYLIGYVAAFFISMASSLIQVIIDMSSKVVSSPLVTEGFKISLSIANLGFVLAIIVIAITTMLRISGYETKKMLRNLVLAAVLVNFSFLIAGTILDFGNVFGNFFLSAASPNSSNYSGFAANLANSLNIQKLSGIGPKDAQSVAGALTGFGAAYVSLFASTAAIAIFSIFLVITFFAIAFMLMARYIYITVLLILMPMAWLTWIFPGFSHLFSKWWSKFIQWALFYPAVTFFLYLGILTSQKLGALVQSGLPQQLAQSTGELANIGTANVVALIQVFVQVGILLGGLMAANMLGIEGASTALGYASKAKNWMIGATGKAARLPLTGAKAAAEYGGARPTKAGARVLSGILQSRGARWIPGAQSAAANLAAIGSRKEEVEGYQKQYLSHLTKDQFESMQKHPPVGPVAKAAILAESAKRGAIGGLTEKIPDTATPSEKADLERKNGATLQMYVQAAKDVNPKIPVDSIPAIKEVLNVNPEFVEKLSIPKDGGGVVGIDDVVKKMRADKAADIDKGALKNPKVVLAMNQAQISSIYRSASGTHIENMEKTLKDILKGDKNFSELENSAEALAKVQGEITEKKQVAVSDADKKELRDLKMRLSDLIKKQKDAYKTATAEQRDAFDKLKIMKQRVGNPNP